MKVLAYGTRETETGRFSVVRVTSDSRRVYHSGIRHYGDEGKAQAEATAEAQAAQVPYVAGSADSIRSSRHAREVAEQDFSVPHATWRKAAPGFAQCTWCGGLMSLNAARRSSHCPECGTEFSN